VSRHGKLAAIRNGLQKCMKNCAKGATEIVKGQWSASEFTRYKSTVKYGPSRLRTAALVP
jgi:hypothetical protein